MKTINWPFPLPRTHCGIALGNGLCGALIWGRDRIHVTVNRSDLWDHRGGFEADEGMSYARVKKLYDPRDVSKLESAVFAKPPPSPHVYRPSRLPLGRFEFELVDGVQPVCASLAWNEGVLRVILRNRRCPRTAYAVAFAFDPARPLLAVLDPQRVVKSVYVRPAWEWVKGWQKKLAFQPPRTFRRSELCGWMQELPDDPAVAAVYRRLPKGGGLIALARGESGRAAADNGVQEINACLQRGLDALLASSRRWWRAYWKDVPRVNVPDDFFNRFFVYALFKFGAATNPLSRVPAGLQGPWVEEYQPTPWEGDYHFNVNVQQIYSLAFPASKFNHLLPLFDMLESWRPVLRHNARCVAGIDDGLLIGMCTDDRGRCLYGGAGVLLDHAGSAWAAQLFWLYYTHSGDIDFLRRRAYPFMAGVMRVYEALLERRAGKLSIPLAISAEYGNLLSAEGKGNMGRDPSWQLAACHMLANALLEASRVLRLKPRPIWRDIQARLPRYTLIGRPGEERIAIWRDQDLDVCHRHHSHLAGIYPFDSLGNPTPRQLEILENSIDHWILKGMGSWSEWCLPWAAIIQARMGFSEAPLTLLNIWRDVFVNEGWATVYLPRVRGITVHRRADLLKPKELNEVMQLDGAMGAATALCELLVHTKRGTTHVFPAVSDKWRQVEFQNIRVPGPFLISASKRDGAVRWVKIKSPLGGRLSIDVPGIRWMLLKGVRHRPRRLRLPATIVFKSGETKVMVPDKPKR